MMEGTGGNDIPIKTQTNTGKTQTDHWNRADNRNMCIPRSPEILMHFHLNVTHVGLLKFTSSKQKAPSAPFLRN